MLVATHKRRVSTQQVQQSAVQPPEVAVHCHRSVSRGGAIRTVMGTLSAGKSKVWMESRMNTPNLRQLHSHAMSAPHCYTWLMTASKSGQQETYSLFGCTDIAGVGTLLPTDPASSNSSISGSVSGSGKGHGVSGGTIAGAVIGGLAALGLIALLLLYIKRQRKTGAEESRRAQEEQKKKDDEDEDFRHDLLAARKKGHRVDHGLGMTQETTTDAATAATMADMNSSRMYPPETDHSVANVSLNGCLSHSVSGVSRTTGSSLGPSPSRLVDVVEAPDTAVEESGSPVEVAGTKITRESMPTRYELA